MLYHYFLIAIRNIRRSRSMFLINLVGLSTGLACTLLIYLWVNDELHVDHFFENDSRLFQVMQNVAGENGTQTIERTPCPLGKALGDEMPEVAFTTTCIPTQYNSSNGIVSIDGKRMKAVAQYASRDFFQVLPYPLMYGDRAQVLADKNGVVLSDVLATKLFGEAGNAIGKSIEWHAMDIGGVYFVSGIFQAPPSGATLHFDVAINLDVFLEKRESVNVWNYSGPTTLVVLKEGADAVAFNKKVASFLQTKDKTASGTVWLQRYADRYLYGHYENGVATGGRVAYVTLFSFIAIFILVIACINFMNLSTARASRRIKEVGIKKTVGASRQALILQHLGESTLTTFAALGVAVLLADLLLTPFNDLSGKHLALSFDGNFIRALLGITLFTGLLSGSYPAFYLSAFRPADVLKGKLKTSGGEVWTRKGLVVFQFALSVVLITAVWIVYEQMKFIQSKNLGYTRDHVIFFATENPTDAFLSEIRNIPGVLGAAGFFHGVTNSGDYGAIRDLEWEGKERDDQTAFINITVGYDFIETLGMKIAAGQSFNAASAVTNQVILNETAIREMKLADPVGKIIRIWGDEKQIAGVVKDFHYQSLYEKINPCFLLLAPTASLPKIMVNIKAGTERETIAALQNKYRQHNSGVEFSYTFLDDDYQRQYTAEQRVSMIARYFAGLAILISCLGLLGLSVFTAERRIKEIGVRKVLGAGVTRIVFLLSGGFMRTVLLSVGIAMPLAYLIARQWLNAFAFRIALHWWYFAGAGTLVLAVAALTISLQAIKAARVNPVKCLHEE